MKAALLLLVLAACPTRAQFTSSGDQTITGATGVGTATPRAALDAVMSPADDFAVWVASQNGTTLLVVDKTGKTGIGTSSPGALLDVKGSGQPGDIGLQLRAGNSSSTYSSAQIVFAYDSSGTYRDSLRTRAAAGQAAGNGLDFFLWRDTAQPTALGDLRALSIEGSTSAFGCAVQVRPSTDAPIYELTVSDGQNLGRGALMAGDVRAHSSRALKTVLAESGDRDARAAYDRVKALKHARFRYKGRAGPSAPVRGLIYEDLPAEVQDARGKSVVFEERLAGLEMALAEVDRRSRELERRIAEAERGGGR